MKLKNSFVSYQTGDEYLLVATGQEKGGFRGMVRSNRTTAFVMDCLRQEISRDGLVEKLLEK